MPTYSMSAPDGNTYRIDGPAGASDEQVRAEILRQHPNAGKESTLRGVASRAQSFWHGMQKGTPSDVMPYSGQDPATGKLIPTPEPMDKPKPQPPEKHPGWEFAGELAASPGGALRVGAGRLASAAAGPVARALGIGAGERTAPLAAARGAGVAGTLQAARGADAAAAASTSRLARASAELPGGGPIRRAVTAQETQKAGLTADEIVRNLSGGQPRALTTAAGRFQGMEKAERAEVAAFWKTGGFDQAWQALRDPQQAKLLGKATSVLSDTSRTHLAAEMLSRMGRDTAGNFSADAFLKDWGAITPEARKAVFGPAAVGKYASDMTDLAESVQRIQTYAAKRPLRDLAKRIPHPGKIGAVGTGLLVLGAAELHSAGTIIHALLSPKLAAGVAAGAGANYALAQALTNPATVKWLAAQAAKQAALYEARADQGAAEKETRDWLSEMH